jgi:hypothetical protein
MEAILTNRAARTPARNNRHRLKLVTDGKRDILEYS